jgi:hypothetical protein
VRPGSLRLPVEAERTIGIGKGNLILATALQMDANLDRVLTDGFVIASGVSVSVAAFVYGSQANALINLPTLCATLNDSATEEISSSPSPQVAVIIAR